MLLLLLLHNESHNKPHVESKCTDDERPWIQPRVALLYIQHISVTFTRSSASLPALHHVPSFT